MGKTAFHVALGFMPAGAVASAAQPVMHLESANPQCCQDLPDGEPAE
ncbi:MAG: hypothetical protein ISS78_07720 [Phycisphaerae bacterium]|nr:hypothetical protein [Phycisphaerae bacterium]